MTTSILLALALQTQALPLDTAYERLIREATTDKRFLPASVVPIPYHPTIPSPLDHFGTISGAPGVMHRAGTLYAYYRALGDASPRVSVETIGRTEEGREMLLVIVADEALLARLDDNQRLVASLGDPRVTDEAAVERILGTAVPVYYVMGGLHSPEMGPPEMLPELAYRLAVSDDPMIRRIREHVITIIVPVAEPDGRDRQVDWYYRYTKGRTDWTDGFPRSSPYWGKYVFHDNNRDGLQISQALTKAIQSVYFDWRPVVMHDLHESVPLLYVSTGTGPYNRTVDPITITEWQTLANWDVQKLTEQGLPGVWTWGFYDGWWPGYAIWVAINHNNVGRFYETFGNAGADTHLRDLRTARYAGDPVTSAQWYRAWPPTKKVNWSLRNNTNYMQAGVLASLDYVARNGSDLLRNFWRKSRNSLERGKTQTPHAFVIPGFDDQRDPARTALLVNQLLRHGIEVHRATDTLAGSFVVRLDQPYRDFAVNLLTKQDYPSEARYPPYDDVAWTLGLLYGVEVEQVDDTSVFQWRGLEPVTDPVAWLATAEGGGGRGTWLLRYTGQQELLSAVYGLAERDRRVSALAAESSFVANDTTWPAGTVVMENLTADRAQRLAETYGLSLVRTEEVSVPRHRLDPPRLAVYHTWFSTQDEGWARYWLDQLGVPYTSIHKDDLRDGGLRSRFDVILVPNAGGNTTRWIHGVDARFGPMPYTRTGAFSSHGSPSSTRDMTGGPGFKGMAELERFVDEGGTIIAIENAGRLVVETGIVRDLNDYRPGSLFHPGSIVRVKARRPNHPILYGYPEVTHVFRGNGPLWRTSRRNRHLTVLQYGTAPLADERDTVVTDIMGMPPVAPDQADETDQADSTSADESHGKSSESSQYVLSGMVRSSDEIVGHGAIFDVPAGHTGAGRVVVFTFNPLHRYLNHHDVGMLFNAILNWNDLGATP